MRKNMENYECPSPSTVMIATAESSPCDSVDPPKSKRRRTGEQQATTRKCKRVRFANDQVVSVDNFPTKHLWWQREDLKSIKSNAKSLSNAIFEQKTLASHHFGYKNVVQRTYAQCLHDKNLTAEDKKGLFLWISKGHSRRGLERWSVPSVGRHRQSRRDNMVNGVLATQASLLHLHPGERAPLLREASEQFTLSSKLFAAAMGEADAYAASEDLNNNSKSNDSGKPYCT